MTCVLCAKEQGICTPVMVVPVVAYPLPVYLQFKGTICQKCANGFSMNNFADFMGSWYEMVCDHLRNVRKPAVNPFPNDPSFKWEEFIIDPNFHAEPIYNCRLQFWRAETLAAKGMAQRLGGLK